MELISHSLTPGYAFNDIRSLIIFSTHKVGHHIFSALPSLRFPPKASPKAISGRTSYLRVRLAFHRYPQVIPAFFNIRGFGPPRNFTFASSCSWIGHPVSGLLHHTRALLTLGFPPAPVLNTLTSHDTITRRTVLQKVPHHTLTCSECL